MKVSDYIAECLYEFGIRHVFMVTGGGAMHLNDSFARSKPFTVTYNHHEQACAIGAEGLFRASGSIGVVNVTTGPGGLNVLTGLMGQWTDSIPAIYISGQVKYETTLMSCPNLALRQLGDQEVDIIPIVKNLVKYAKCVTDKNDIRLELERAWFYATSGRMGPVWLDIPMNIQGALIDKNELKGFTLPTSLPLKPSVSKVVDLLESAKRPVFVAGHGIRLAGAVSVFRKMAQHCGLPVVTTFNGFDIIPDESACYCGRIGTLGTRGGNFTLQNADLVITFGSRNNIRQTSYNWQNFAHRALTVAIDIDDAELEKPTFKATHSLQANLADFLPELDEVLSRKNLSSKYASWLAWARERSIQNPVVPPSAFLEKDLLHPYAFMEKFTRHLPNDATVVAGNGSACVVLFQAGIVKQDQRIFWNSGCASMGYDLPAAIGAAVGTGKTVWCLAGDGSLQMNLQELATLGFNKLPVKLVYLNNGGYASIRQTQSNFFQAQYGCGITSGLGFPDMEQLSKAYGIPYMRSSQIDNLDEEIAHAIQHEGALIWEICLKLDYNFEPKLSSEKLPDGRMVSKPLEDMFPFMTREQFESNMLPENLENK